MVRRARAAAALAAAAVLVASCGSGGDDASGLPAANKTPAAAPATTETATATATATAAPARRVKRGVGAVKVADLSSPVYLTSPPGDTRRVYVVEQGGKIRLLLDGRLVAKPFLDISELVTASGEQGLLSMAFSPDYAQSRRFYVYYTDRAADQRIVEYRVRRDGSADPNSARLVLRMADSESNHNGGLLLFGPDHLMYVGTGDGGGAGDQHGSRGNAQDLGSLLGKILRIDPRASGGRPYTVPRSNPFVARAGARPEIYAYGLRNPWRFSFDRKTGDLIIGDVGQGAWEEIDFMKRGRARGANFGWRPFEGRARYAGGESASGHVAPVIVRSHEDGNCSITGGVVVRDPALAGLDGRYVFGDFCRGRIESARLGPGGAFAVRESNLQVNNLSSFGEDARGRVYVLSLSGPIYRLVPR